MSRTVKQVCEHYGVTEHTVLAWIRSGDLKALNVAPANGRRPKWRITDKAIEDFERARSTYPPPRKHERRRRNPAAAGDRY